MGENMALTAIFNRYAIRFGADVTDESMDLEEHWSANPVGHRLNVRVKSAAN
jgi:hypothetical protein